MDPINFLHRHSFFKEPTTSQLRQKHVDVFHRIISQCIENKVHLSSKMLKIPLSQVTVEKIQQETHAKIAEIAFNFATLSVYDKKLFDAIGDKVIQESHRLSSIDIAKIAFAFAELNIHDVPLFQVLSKEVKNKQDELSTLEKEMVLTAFKKIGIYDFELFQAISE